jgi:predicted MFS family arabinose efflux permease
MRREFQVKAVSRFSIELINRQSAGPPRDEAHVAHYPELAYSRCRQLLNAAVLAGFGPFVAVFLGDHGWSQQDIGFVLCAAGTAGLLSQLPGGELLDAIRAKRLLVCRRNLYACKRALIIAFRPNFLLVFAALVLEGGTGGFLGPGITAVSLGIVGHSALAERLGRVADPPRLCPSAGGGDDERARRPVEL